MPSADTGLTGDHSSFGIKSATAWSACNITSTLCIAIVATAGKRQVLSQLMVCRVITSQSPMTAEDWQLESSFSLQGASIPTSVCWRPARSNARKPSPMLLVGSASQAEASLSASSQNFLHCMLQASMQPLGTVCPQVIMVN